jgi:pimeloyl-ACP methyl ester carboxylesterase
MNPALRLPGAAVHAAELISPRAGAAVALPLFAHVGRPRAVHADDAPTMSLARRRSVRIPGVDRRGVDVVVYEWGRGPRTIVLSHGWHGRASQFSALVRELVAEGYRVLAFDGPAHGDSGGRRAYLVDWLDVYAELQRRYGAFDAMIGHSFGGLATLVGVAEGVDAARVVTIAAPADADELFRGFQRMLGHSDAVRARLRERFASRFFPGDPDPFARLSAVRRPLPPGVPLLVAHDRGDRVVPFGEAERIAAATPGATVLTTVGLGHNRILAADVVLDAVVDFATAAEVPVARTPVPPAPALVP